MLIAGDPAVTSSLFKVIGGLWPWGSGRVRLPARRQHAVHAAAAVPARGHAAPRRSAIRARRTPSSDDAIRHALECAGLAWLAPRLDERDNWEQVLPLRAQQRLGFARVLLQRPAWIFMEEATDAFDPKGERLILEMLHRELPDATLLTISFHPGLEPLHHRKIVLTACARRSSCSLAARDGSALTETRRQPAALDAVAKAPRRRGLGAVAPEEPAAVVLEG